ncbi:hypothetical protein CCUS01_07064 [Colletotrichum cuscutae]|uniref:Uncharacterized protein n=1 Tax=Colletotrichum cuscutae TaxID=1209917 RepID=A0AAI9UZN2_9PEZI|nr:hypothetical protein CCUS01_07064 [Colletotrichum cuscutae]
MRSGYRQAKPTLRAVSGDASRNAQTWFAGGWRRTGGRRICMAEQTLQMVRCKMFAVGWKTIPMVLAMKTVSAAQPSPVGNWNISKADERCPSSASGGLVAAPPAYRVDNYELVVAQRPGFATERAWTGRVADLRDSFWRGGLFLWARTSACAGLLHRPAGQGFSIWGRAQPDTKVSALCRLVKAHGVCCTTIRYFASEVRKQKQNMVQEAAIQRRQEEGDAMRCEKGRVKASFVSEDETSFWYTIIAATLVNWRLTMQSVTIGKSMNLDEEKPETEGEEEAANGTAPGAKCNGDGTCDCISVASVPAVLTPPRSGGTLEESRFVPGQVPSNRGAEARALRNLKSEGDAGGGRGAIFSLCASLPLAISFCFSLNATVIALGAATIAWSMKSRVRLAVPITFLKTDLAKGSAGRIMLFPVNPGPVAWHKPRCDDADEAITRVAERTSYAVPPSYEHPPLRHLTIDDVIVRLGSSVSEIALFCSRRCALIICTAKIRSVPISIKAMCGTYLPGQSVEDPPLPITAKPRTVCANSLTLTHALEFHRDSTRVRNGNLDWTFLDGDTAAALEDVHMFLVGFPLSPTPHVCIRQYVPVFAGLPVCWYPSGAIAAGRTWASCPYLSQVGRERPGERKKKRRGRPDRYRAIKPCVACLSDDRKREATLVTVHWHLHSYLDSSHFFPAPPIELTAFKASATRETSVPAALVAVAAVAALLPHNKTTSLPASPICFDLTSSLFPHIQAKHLHPADDTLELNIA